MDEPAPASLAARSNFASSVARAMSWGSTTSPLSRRYAVMSPSAAGRISPPARPKSSSQPPIIVLSTSMSQRNVPGCSAAYLVASVDFPTPGGPLRRISRVRGEASEGSTGTRGGRRA